MKQRFRLFQRRGGVFYSVDNTTGQQLSLKTKDREEAIRILHARNEAERTPAINLQIARAYLLASDGAITTRTWADLMEEVSRAKTGNTKERWDRAMKEEPFDLIRSRVVIETRAEHFLDVLASGTVSTNIFLRRLHNFALDMGFMPTPLIPRKRWPKIRFEEKRAIRLEEHQQILAHERNPEWRAFYSLLWLFGGSQSDIASLQSTDVDWSKKTVSYGRLKTGSNAQIHFGDAAEGILMTLPKEGPLFPMLSKWDESWRAKAFIRRCTIAKVEGVSLHSYRYAWAERAKAAGYPERFAQMALGHNSAAVHRAYAKNAEVKLPSLEQYEAPKNEEKRAA
jgi:integrase